MSCVDTSKCKNGIRLDTSSDLLTKISKINKSPNYNATVMAKCGFL